MYNFNFFNLFKWIKNFNIFENVVYSKGRHIKTFPGMVNIRHSIFRIIPLSNQWEILL